MMNEHEREEFKKLMEDSVNSAMEAKLGPFFIEREQHYLDHAFIKDVRETQQAIKQTFFALMIKGGLTGLGLLLVYGLFDYLKKMVR